MGGVGGFHSFSGWQLWVVSMRADEAAPRQLDAEDGGLDIRCAACRSTLTDMNREAVSFLLLDDLRIPLLGCDVHLETFRSRCGLTTEETAKLLDHRPAGGLACPGCRNAPHINRLTMLPAHDGALSLLACPQHQASAAHRFHTGLHTRLTTPLTNHHPNRKRFSQPNSAVSPTVNVREYPACSAKISQ